MNAKNNIKQYIVGSDSKKQVDAKRQELPKSWSMTFLGFRTIYPGRLDRDDEKIIGMIYTVDILCHNSDSIILAIDCKTSVPENSDITLIKNAADHISKKIFKKVILIIVSENCSSKQTSAVSIMDKKDCEHICDLILKDHVTQATQFFTQSVLDNQNMYYS